MRLSCFFSIWTTTAAIGIGVFCLHSPGQPSPPLPAGPGSPTATNALSATGPAPKSPGRSRRSKDHAPEDPSRPPMAFFRELLAMNPEQRQRALAEKSPESRKKLLDKVAEYESLSPADRELRLRTTELRWHVGFFIKTNPINRSEWLAKIPAQDRPLVGDRLKQWDLLSLEAQKEFIDNERFLHWLFQVQWDSITEQQRTNLLTSLPHGFREHLEKSLAQWLARPQNERQQLVGRFHKFFELDEKEKARILQSISNSEREQMEKSLQVFERLPPSQRKQCIDSFRQFAHMSKAERDQFLKNAKRWEEMSPGERETWRHMVQEIPISPPPLPPGLRNMPPLPPDLLRTNASQ